jgi:hypothetical protein
VTYFGLPNENKGIEHLFDIIDFNTTRLILICSLTQSKIYEKKILDLIQNYHEVIVTGKLDEIMVSNFLAVSDASVFPFVTGAGNWSSSINAAKLQSTLVVTTSKLKTGYDEDTNTCFANPGDVTGMKKFLYKYIGTKCKINIPRDWEQIVDEHINIYKKIHYG